MVRNSPKISKKHKHRVLEVWLKYFVLETAHLSWMMMDRHFFAANIQIKVSLFLFRTYYVKVQTSWIHKRICRSNINFRIYWFLLPNQWTRPNLHMVGWQYGKIQTDKINRIGSLSICFSLPRKYFQNKNFNFSIKMHCKKNYTIIENLWGNCFRNYS